MRGGGRVPWTSRASPGRICRRAWAGARGAWVAASWVEPRPPPRVATVRERVWISVSPSSWARYRREAWSLSPALDPFPHHHNVIANTVEDHTGGRRTLDARGLYQHAQASSALATAEMRYQLTRSLGVRWRPGRSGGWEIAGIPDPVLREFSRRRREIDNALRELEDAIRHNPGLQELDRIVLKTRPAKQHVPVDELLDGWRTRATALGFGRDQLAACLDRALELPEADPATLYTALAAPDGICANLSIFNRADVLAALVDLPVPHDDGEPQPLLIPAARLESLAHGFLASRHVIALTPGRYTSREILAVQQRIVARYRHGLHRSAALVPSPAINQALAGQPELTDEQRQLVRAFCTSGHRIQCAIGRAGAGKTTTMAAARYAWQAAGWRVIGTAIKGEAARTLGAATGMPTETLAWYLAHDDPARAPLDARTVLVVDEASTISDRDLDRLGWLAGHTGAPLRPIGHPAQHGAIEAGGMVRVLCERHPQDTPRLTRTHRLQSSHDRAAAASSPAPPTGTSTPPDGPTPTSATAPPAPSPPLPRATSPTRTASPSTSTPSAPSSCLGRSSTNTTSTPAASAASASTTPTPSPATPSPAPTTPPPPAGSTRTPAGPKPTWTSPAGAAPTTSTSPAGRMTSTASTSPASPPTPSTRPSPNDSSPHRANAPPGNSATTSVNTAPTAPSPH